MNDDDLDTLAALHRAAFVVPRPWTKAEITDLLAGKGTFVWHGAGPAMVMGRVIADEAELLTLAVHPDARKRGYGRAALRQFDEMASQRGAQTAFLEVAADNLAAYALYVSENWRESGRRKNYYSGPDGRKIDALTFSKSLV